MNTTLNPLQQFMLVLLRFLAGWHLFYQGLGKYWAVGWSSKGYLAGSTGPFADLFHGIADNPTLLRIADNATIWGLMILGVLLMLGLFTRTAALCAFFLLLLFFLAVPPTPYLGFTVPSPDGYELYVNKTLIEALLFLLIVVFPTGQMAGLDILVRQWRRRRESYFGRS